ncbi:hypothetical protein MN608_10073 [Microdochium nivale]|nr:hypothetical protein MN608_10073 [Microdochium nivale]
MPRLGFRCPCILNLALALSAHHMGRSSRLPTGTARLRMVAQQQIAAALWEATVLLGDFDGYGNPALYMIPVLMCFTALAQGPRQGNLLVANDGSVPWMSLLRGVRLVISTSGWSLIFSRPLA